MMGDREGTNQDMLVLGKGRGRERPGGEGKGTGHATGKDQIKTQHMAMLALGNVALVSACENAF